MAVIRFNYRATALHGATNVTIILPTDHSKDGAPSVYVPGVKYQVLWLLHGGLGDDQDFINFSNIVRYAEDARVAVVMPSCPDKFYDGAYYQLVSEELPKVLRVIFPFSDKKEDNFVAGLSHGGDCSLKLCLEHPDRYAAGLVMSAAGTTHFRDPKMQNHVLFDVFGMAEKNIASGAQLPHIFFATGSGDRGFSAYTPIIDKLDEMGLPLTRLYEEGDGHSWNFWDKMLKEGLGSFLPLKHEVIFPE